MEYNMKYKVSISDSMVFDTKEEADLFCNKIKNEYNVNTNVNTSVNDVLDYENYINIKQYSELMNVYESNTVN